MWSRRSSRVEPVSATVKASLELARKQTEQQRGFLTKREQDKIDLAKEYDETLNRYRELARAKAEAQR